MAALGDDASVDALAHAMQRQDYIIEVPELDGVVIAPGHDIQLENIESDHPVLRVGLVVFEGQHQQFIGTAFVVGHPAAPSNALVNDIAHIQRAPSHVDVHALTQRRIVMKLVSGSVASLGQPGKK